MHGDLCKHLGIDSSTNHPECRVCGASVNSIDHDQTPQNAASDQGLHHSAASDQGIHYLLTECQV